MRPEVMQFDTVEIRRIVFIKKTFDWNFEYLS